MNDFPQSPSISQESFLAPAKLNLFLHVVGRREDGYHLIQSVFQLIDLADTLTITPRADGRVLRRDAIAGVAPQADLALRAAERLKAATGSRLGADIAITKRIPLGGGLGGGSSDAATTLLVLNRLWGLDLPRAELMRIGLSLGADVPFFLFGANAFVEGVGEVMAPLALPPRRYVVVHPGVAVQTASIYSAPELTRNTAAIKLSDFSKNALRPDRAGSRMETGETKGACRRNVVDGGRFDRDSGFTDWNSGFANDLEAVAVRRHEAVRDALEWLGHDAAGALGAARMSGSGACVFREFASQPEAAMRLAMLPSGWAGWNVASLAAHPHRALAGD